MSPTVGMAWTTLGTTLGPRRSILKAPTAMGTAIMLSITREDAAAVQYARMSPAPKDWLQRVSSAVDIPTRK